MEDPNAYSTTNTQGHTPTKPQIRNSRDQNDENTSQVARQPFYIRLKGLPWGCTKQQICEFFQEQCSLDEQDINLLVLPNGRASGEALVGVATENDFNFALEKLNKRFIENRYIDLHRSSPEEWERIFQRENKHHKVPISDSSLVILLRGLPYTAHEDDCLSFFNRDRKINCLGVHLTKDASGRPSGQGYAEFSNKADFDDALKLHKEEMQNRYIELFESSIAELVENVTGRSQRKNFDSVHYAPTEGIGGTYHTTVPDPQGAPACIRMRGLPYKTKEREITTFFQRENVTPSRIHRKEDGAEAFVEFGNPAHANLAMKLNKAFMGKRYVELFRVDYEEMAAQVGIRRPSPSWNYNTGGSQQRYGGGRGSYRRGGYGGRGRGRGSQRFTPYNDRGRGGYGGGRSGGGRW